MPTQNTTHAVMAQRFEPEDSPDDFPTPPWATRALIECIIGCNGLDQQSCLEPACGRGYMSRPLAEYFAKVHSADAYEYGFGEKRDFLAGRPDALSYDWVITNPPFRLAERFVERALLVARRGVAILARTVFLESVGRYEGLFRDRPPSIFAQFTERVPMVRGRLDAKASTATGYGWLIWMKDRDNAGSSPGSRLAVGLSSDLRTMIEGGSSILSSLGLPTPLDHRGTVIGESQTPRKSWAF